MYYLLLDLRGGASTTGVALVFDCLVFALLAIRAPIESGADRRWSPTPRVSLLIR